MENNYESVAYHPEGSASPENIANLPNLDREDINKYLLTKDEVYDPNYMTTPKTTFNITGDAKTDVLYGQPVFDHQAIGKQQSFLEQLKELQMLKNKIERNIQLLMQKASMGNSEPKKEDVPKLKKLAEKYGIEAKEYKQPEVVVGEINTGTMLVFGTGGEITEVKDISF